MNFTRLVSHCLAAISVAFLQFPVTAQQIEFSNKFSEAVKLSEENEQNLASQIWTELARNNPDNGNVNYRAGLAYLNAGSNRTAALPYLQRALEIGINLNYDRFSPQETKSPVEVHYYLGKAYHLNYKLEQAQESYNTFLAEASRKHFLRSNAELGIAQASNAQKLVKEPVSFEIENLGSQINSEYPEFSPVISVDENALFFTSSRVRPDSSNINQRDQITGQYFNDIYVSYKDRKGAWQEPELLEINKYDHTATVNVSADGQILYMYRDDAGVGNIYESKLVGEMWTEPAKMGGGINSSSWETHIAISIDGESAFFVSNRPGGLGGRDIFQVRKLPNGEWSQAKNLGATINTPYEEDAVFITADGKTLYFSSEGHNSMGGFDVFQSSLDEETGNWNSPVNIGYPINTVDDDVFFVTSADGRRAYYSSFKETGFGEKDIYMVAMPSPREVKLALLMGKIFAADNSQIPANLTVHVTNVQTQHTDVFTPRSRDGGFVAILPPCYNYEVDYMVGGLVLASDTFTVDCESAYQEIYKELLINPLRIEKDGTATVVRDGSGALLVSSTKADLQPANFKKYFGYNENSLAQEEVIFIDFMKEVKRMSEAKPNLSISVEGSASRVPTRTHGSNERLAKVRAENAAERIKNYATTLGIDMTKIAITTQYQVNGPPYNADAKEGAEDYRKFQYIDVIVQ